MVYSEYITFNVLGTETVGRYQDGHLLSIYVINRNFALNLSLKEKRIRVTVLVSR